MSYQFQDTGHIGSVSATHKLTKEVAKEANLEEQGQLEAIDAFLNKLASVYSKEKDGKYSVVVSGESKHDGARLKIEFVLRKVVLPHQNALEGSKAAQPPTREEVTRKEGRIADTRHPGGDAPLPAHKEDNVTKASTPLQAETKASS